MISVRRSRAEEVEIYEIVWKITTSRSKDMAINPAFISPCGLSRIDEEARYVCPECGNKVFRGSMKCNQCKAPLDLD